MSCEVATATDVLDVRWLFGVTVRRAENVVTGSGAMQQPAARGR